MLGGRIGGPVGLTEPAPQASVRGRDTRAFARSAGILARWLYWPCSRLRAQGALLSTVSLRADVRFSLPGLSDTHGVWGTA